MTALETSILLFKFSVDVIQPPHPLLTVAYHCQKAQYLAGTNTFSLCNLFVCLSINERTASVMWTSNSQVMERGQSYTVITFKPFFLLGQLYFFNSHT